MAQATLGRVNKLLCLELTVLGKRIKEARNRRGLTQQELSELVGVSYQQIQNYEKTSHLDSDRLKQLAELLDVSIPWLLGLESSPSPAPVPHVHWGEAPPDDLSTDDYVFIPLYESRAAATPAVMEVGTDEVEGWACIHASRLGVAGSSQLRAFRVRGDSMKPEILDGDMVAIQYYDVGPDHLEPSAIYAIRIEDNGDVGISLKHVTQHDEHTLLIESVNQEREETGARKFPSRIIDTRDYSYNPIAGRVVWMWREY